MTVLWWILASWAAASVVTVAAWIGVVECGRRTARRRTQRTAITGRPTDGPPGTREQHAAAPAATVPEGLMPAPRTSQHEDTEEVHAAPTA